jgi:hypothetical protein
MTATNFELRRESASLTAPWGQSGSGLAAAWTRFANDDGLRVLGEQYRLSANAPARLDAGQQLMDGLRDRVVAEARTARTPEEQLAAQRTMQEIDDASRAFLHYRSTLAAARTEWSRPECALAVWIGWAPAGGPPDVLPLEPLSRVEPVATASEVERVLVR